jgi:hypothetical protein
MSEERKCAVCESPLPEKGYFRCPYCRKMLDEKCAQESEAKCPDCKIELEHFKEDLISCSVCGTTSMKRGHFTCPNCDKTFCKICFGSYGGLCPDDEVDLKFVK